MARGALLLVLDASVLDASIGCRTYTLSDVSNQHSVILGLKLGDIGHSLDLFWGLSWAIALAD
jgi:hypothetical protein